MQPLFLEHLAQSTTSRLKGGVTAGVDLEDLVVEGGHSSGHGLGR